MSLIRSHSSLPSPFLPPLAATEAPLDDILRCAGDALQSMRAWLNAPSFQRGDHRTILPHGDANALARALLVSPAKLPPETLRTVLDGRALLAMRAPGKPLQLSADQARTLDHALAVVTALNRSTGRDAVGRHA